MYDTLTVRIHQHLEIRGIPKGSRWQLWRVWEAAPELDEIVVEADGEEIYDYTVLLYDMEPLRSGDRLRVKVQTKKGHKMGGEIVFGHYGIQVLKLPPEPISVVWPKLMWQAPTINPGGIIDPATFV